MPFSQIFSPSPSLTESIRLFYKSSFTYSGASLVAPMVKNLPAMQETCDPWVGKVSWGRKWLPTPVFLPGKFHGQRSLAGYSLWGCSELGTTEGLTLSPLILSSLLFLDLEMMTFFSWLWINFSLQLADISLDAGHWEHFSVESIVLFFLFFYFFKFCLQNVWICFASQLICLLTCLILLRVDVEFC